MKTAHNVLISGKGKEKAREMKLPSASVITLGCKVNQYESEAISERLAALGFSLVGPDEPADICIINTCAVTGEAERKSRNMIRRAHRRASAVIVCGCLSQSVPDVAAAFEGVACVIGNGCKLRAADEALDIIKNGAPERPRVLVGDIYESKTVEKMSVSASPRTRAYVKICDGCDGRCAYCLIPSMRGHVRSRATADIIEEIAALASGGVREVVLTGIETASFGRDTGETLPSLIRAVAAVPGIARIRLGSLEPTVITEEFVAAARELPSLVPHYHLSLQSGCTRTLNAMRRKYNAPSAEGKLEALRAAIPGVMFTTDIIVGFPGETDEDFAETLDFVRRARFLQLHVFQFSPRRGTAAEKMSGQIPADVKHTRSASLIAEGERIRNEVVRGYIAENPCVPVLFESDEDGMHSGHTANYIEVRTPLCGVRQGEIRAVTFSSVRNGVAFGEVTGGSES